MEFINRIADRQGLTAQDYTGHRLTGSDSVPGMPDHRVLIVRDENTARVGGPFEYLGIWPVQQASSLRRHQIDR
jgi:hypothetical protein